MSSKWINACLCLAPLLAGACPGDTGKPEVPALAAQDRTKFVDAAVLAAMPVPKVLDEPRLRALLEAAPDAAALAYLAEDVFFEKDDTRFISMLMALVGSKNPEIARMASDMVSGSYVVAMSAGVDVGPAIDVALKSKSAATRRVVVRGLGLPECAAARAWLRAHESDEEQDEVDPAHPTVASEAKFALACLNAAAAAERSIVPTDALVAFECAVGGSERVPLSDAETSHAIAVTDVQVGSIARWPGGPPLPAVTARVSLQTVNGIANLVLPKKDTPAFSFGLTSNGGAYLLAWTRPVARNRIRVWFRASPPGR